MAVSVMDFPCWNVSWGTAANNWESCATALGLDWPPLKVFTYVIGSMRVAMRATGTAREVSREASRSGKKALPSVARNALASRTQASLGAPETSGEGGSFRFQ